MCMELLKIGDEMKYLHIFSFDNNEKFSKTFINFINKHFDEREHHFIMTSGIDYTPSDLQESNVSVGSAI